MNTLQLLQPLGTAGAIIIATVVLLAQIKKLSNDGLAKKVDAISRRLGIVERDVSYIRGMLDKPSQADATGPHEPL